MPEAVTTDRKHHNIAVAPELADRCLACGTCIGSCPATESVPGWDARKAIRALALGLEEEVVDSKWPWVCTMCGRCEYNCPQGVKLTKTFRACRGARERDKVPGTLHKGILMNLERGNNFGMPLEDYRATAGRAGGGNGRGSRTTPARDSMCRWTKKGANLHGDDQRPGAVYRAG